MWKVLLATGLLASPAFAQDSASATPGFSGQGAGEWKMICHVVTGGDQQPVILNPARPQFASATLKQASCTYSASANGDLVITINGAAKCPFKGATESACIQTLRKSHPGSFDFKVKSAR